MDRPSDPLEVQRDINQGEANDALSGGAVVTSAATPSSRRPLRLILPLAVVVVIILVVGFIVYENAASANITIGATTITPADIKQYSAGVNRYNAATKTSLGKPANQVAEGDLILNAALKEQAAQHGVTVTQSDIDASLAASYKSFGSKAAYDAYYSRLGALKFLQTRAENSLYETKLQKYVIASKDVFVVSIGIDTPYVNASKNPGALIAQAVKTMQSKFLPMFQKGWSNDKIAAQTDIDSLQESANSKNAYQISQLYFTGMPTEAHIFTGCVDNTCFNDLPQYRPPGAVYTKTEMSTLTKTGQYTGVFTSKAGFVGIMRLSSKTQGSYDSWSQFQQFYENKFAKQLAKVNQS